MISLKSHLLLVFILSFLAIHIPLLLSTVNEYLEVCNPYFDGCFSISRSSRQPVSIFIFKPLMIISALSLYFLWPRLLNKNYKRIFIYICQIVSLFLIIYTFALVNDGNLYEIMRRYGIFIFYVFTLFSQWAYCFSFNPLNKKFFSRDRILFYLSILQIIMFISSSPFYIYFKNDGHIENIYEWWITLSIIIWFFVNFLYYNYDDRKKRD